MTWYSWALIALFALRVLISINSVGKPRSKDDLVHDSTDAFANIILLVAVTVVVWSLN